MDKAGEINQKVELKTAVLGGGCFWCIEAVLEKLRGVQQVESGYAGGAEPNPTYELVSSGLSGHAEVVKLSYDPRQISYGDLLKVFFHLHDPTSLNRQGNDVGPQYRSVIFYASEEEQQVALAVKKEIEASGLWSKPIVTEIKPLSVFYPAEKYHQNYYELNKSKPYCSYVIAPKIQKLYRDFGDKLK